MKKVLLSLGAVAMVLVALPMFSAFEAHVINVTAKIENALSVPVSEIDFGTVFPQEKLDKQFDVSLSQSFKDEDRVDDVEYYIRQKPKCWDGNETTPTFGRVTEDAQGNFVCVDEGFTMLPILCPYLSKHELTTDGTQQENDTGINAFHGLPGSWTLATTLATQVTGRLAKSVQDFTDTWNVDLRVPCFGGHCAQDWDDFVQNSNPADLEIDPSAYIQPQENEHKLFGCDLWVEVYRISLAGGPPIGCEDELDLMLVLDRSGSIGDTNMGVLQTAAKAFVDALGLGTPGPHAGMVSFASGASLDVHLTDDAVAVKAAIDLLVSSGLTALGDGINTAKTELDNPGDGHDRLDAGSPDYMVIITDGAPNTGADSATAAAAAKAAGITIYVVGVGTTGGTETFLRDTIATSPAHYFSIANYDDLQALLSGLVNCPA
ncbi:MAG: vWA domain-containing protein [Patescibacteria group bacterium]|mgnify:CR=1 FL=1